MFDFQESIQLLTAEKRDAIEKTARHSGRSQRVALHSPQRRLAQNTLSLARILRGFLVDG